eukprot:10540204-Prorocentrum_lima.AAC.1
MGVIGVREQGAEIPESCGSQLLARCHVVTTPLPGRRQAAAPRGRQDRGAGVVDQRQVMSPSCAGVGASGMYGEEDLAILND